MINVLSKAALKIPHTKDVTKRSFFFDQKVNVVPLSNDYQQLDKDFQHFLEAVFEKVIKVILILYSNLHINIRMDNRFFIRAKDMDIDALSDTHKHTHLPSVRTHVSMLALTHTHTHKLGNPDSKQHKTPHTPSSPSGEVLYLFLLLLSSLSWCLLSREPP